MCYGGESLWVPAVIAAVGAGASAYQQHQTARDQDKQAAINITQQAADQRQMNQQVNQTVKQLKDSTPDAARNASAQAFVDQLRQAKAQSTQQGNVGASSRYNADVGAANNATDAASATTANNLATINGTQLQRVGEAQAQQQLGSTLGTLANNSSMDQFLGQLRLRGITGNPWVSAGADFLSGLGSGLAKSGNYGKKKPPPSFTPTNNDYTPPPSGSPYNG